MDLHEILPFKLGGQELSQGVSEALSSHAEVSVRVEDLEHPTVDLQHRDAQGGAAELVHQDVAGNQPQAHWLTAHPHSVNSDGVKAS